MHLPRMALDDLEFLRDPKAGRGGRCRGAEDLKENGSSGRIRTYNPSVNSRMLYH
jgi:hypothetical protein